MSLIDCNVSEYGSTGQRVFAVSEKPKDDNPDLKDDGYIAIKIHPKTQEFIDLLDKMKAVALAKSHDYAGDSDPMSNFRMCETMGIPGWKGIVIRLGDKYSRIMNFCKKESLQVKDESIIDTLLDMANYSLLCIILYNQSKEK